MKTNTMKNIFWGLILLAAGAILIISKMGYFGGISMRNLCFSIILALIAIKSLFSLHFAGVTIPLAIIGILYDKELGIEMLTPWTLLAAAVLAAIGLSFLFTPLRKKLSDKHYHAGKKHRPTNADEFEKINEEDGEVIVQKTKFSGTSKYINSVNMQRVELECKFGAQQIYFENAQIPSGYATVYIDASFSGIELYVPKSWYIVNNIHTFAAGVDEKNTSNPDGNTTLELCGNISMSGIDIIRV